MSHNYENQKKKQSYARKAHRNAIAKEVKRTMKNVKLDILQANHTPLIVAEKNLRQGSTVEV